MRFARVNSKFLVLFRVNYNKIRENSKYIMKDDKHERFVCDKIKMSEERIDFF